MQTRLRALAAMLGGPGAARRAAADVLAALRTGPLNAAAAVQ
jgi:hypothetical protein